MDVEKIREYFIMQVELVNAVTKDVVKHNASEEILNYVTKGGHCRLDGSEDHFIRVEFGSAYAYLNVEDGKPISNRFWWNNEDLGCGNCDYERTIAKLNAMTDKEIIVVSDMEYVDLNDLDVPIYVPMKCNL